MFRLEGTPYSHCVVRPPRSRLLATLALPPLLPVLWGQGKWVRRRTPILPEARGPDAGEVPAQGAALRLVVLGESTVAGIGARTHEVGLTGRVAQSVATLLGRAVRWRALGLTGTTVARATRELVPRLEGRADVLVVVLGVNDTIALTPAARYRRQLQALIGAARERVGHSPVVLAGVPPLHRFPAFPQPLRATLGTRAFLMDEAAREVAVREKDVHHVATLIRDGHDFSADRFHPSEVAYAAWGEYLGAAVAIRLEEQAERRQRLLEEVQRRLQDPPKTG